MTVALAVVASILAFSLGFFCACLDDEQAQVDGHIRIGNDWYELVWHDGEPSLGKKV